jgi:hypothetical protein
MLANPGLPSPISTWRNTLYPEPELAVLADQLALAEQRGHHLVAARLAVRFGSLLGGYGRYRAAAYWLDWALHLYHRKGRADSFESLLALGDWAALRALLGQTADVEAAIDRCATHLPARLQWLVGRARVHLLLAADENEAAIAECAILWHEATRRDMLLRLAPQYAQVLVRAGRDGEALSVAERALVLAEGRDEDRMCGLLSAGIALSRTNPLESCEALEAVRSGRIPSMLRAQMVVYLSEAFARTGASGKAQQLLERERSLLAEIAPGGLAYLSHGHSPGEADESRTLELRFLGARDISFNGSSEPLRLRFAEIVAVLAAHPEGMTAEQLTIAVYGESQDPACCKTELSRLRRAIPIQNRPYRLAAAVWGDFLQVPTLLKAGELAKAIDLYHGPLLPESESPEVCDLRDVLDESLREAVLQKGQPEQLWALVARMRDDLELWEAVGKRLPEGDPRRPLAQAQVHSLRRAWNRDFVGHPRAPDRARR